MIKHIYSCMVKLCHAAAWIIEGIKKPPHGEAFQRWGQRAFLITGLPVTRCHNYNVSYKHNWKCVGNSTTTTTTTATTKTTNHMPQDKSSKSSKGCGAVIGRHSKSIDVTKQICARCRGKLQYVGRNSTNNNKQCSSADLCDENVSVEKEPPPFAKYVKDNYQSAKLVVQKARREEVTSSGAPRRRAPSPSSPLPQVSHSSIMAHLSKQWAERDL
jgi:hypothetical protein